MTISGAGVWSAVKGVVNAAYKLAFLYLAYVFVSDAIAFHEFTFQATKAFYVLLHGGST
jgi:hypothetical protein